MYVIIIAGTVLWFSAFVFIRWNSQSPQKIDRRARWGILLEAVSYSLLWQGRFWERSPEVWRTSLSTLLFVLAIVLSWAGARALGRHLRVDAGLSEDHRLVRSGPYRVVRHPIYASMLCVLLGAGILIAPWLLLALAVMVFLVGTEIRVRVEDALLAARFGEDFRAYQRAIPAYIPFLR